MAPLEELSTQWVQHNLGVFLSFQEGSVQMAQVALSLLQGAPESSVAGIVQWPVHRGASQVSLSGAQMTFPITSSQLKLGH